MKAITLSLVAAALAIASPCKGLAEANLGNLGDLQAGWDFYT